MRFRNRHRLILILLILLLITACSSNHMKYSPEEATKEIVALLHSGNYKTVYNDWFDDELKESLSSEELENWWLDLVEDKGDFIEVSSIVVEERGENLQVVEGKVIYRDITFGIRLIFNDKGSLVGFNLSGALVNVNMPDTIIEEEIIVGKGSDYELAGILTLPKEGNKNLPALILVHGSGPTDRDESAYAYKPFRDLAWGLAEEGIASIRYDKRTFVYGQDMAQDLRNLTVYEETVEDAIRASQLAKEDPRIDREKVFILGHSLGGMLAARIDAQGGDFAGLIILGGTSRSLWEIIYDQNHYFLELESMGSDEKEEYLKLVEEEYEKGLALKDMTLEDSKEISIFGINGFYLREMEEYSTRSLIENLEKPILVLHGEDDFQVYYDKDFAILKDLLGDKENARLISYENLNHFFVDYEGPDKGRVEEYNHPGRVSGEVIEDIAKWILEN